jgi:hypothetical protein
MAIQCVHTECWMPKHTDTHSPYVILLFSTTTMFALTHLNVMLYPHCLSCYFMHLFVYLFIYVFLSSVGLFSGAVLAQARVD